MNHASTAHPRAYGKIVSLSFCHTSCTAHPHAYGECEAVEGVVVVMGSSPPRIRGMLSAQQFDAMADELTPAHTGNALSHKA